MNQEFIKRLKSFAWRTGCMVAVSLIAFLVKNLELFELPTWAVALIGLLAGEATKWLNNNTALFGSKLK